MVFETVEVFGIAHYFTASARALRDAGNENIDNLKKKTGGSSNQLGSYF